MANNNKSDDNLLIWGIILLFLFFPAGIVLLVMYADRKKSKSGSQASAYGSISPSYWSVWDDSVHLSEGQPARIQRALVQNIVIGNQNAYGRYLVTGTKGIVYLTDFGSCTCDDFRKRKGRPCKHMYALAIAKAGFNPFPYFTKNDVVPHPLRGYMNLGLFKVKGKNLDTNRFNTKTLHAVDEAAAIAAGKAAGLADPVTATECELAPASAETLQDAVSKGVFIPSGAKELDAQAAIARFRDWDETTITRLQWEYAASLGVPISALAGNGTGKLEFSKIHKRWLSDEKLVIKNATQ